MKLKTTITLFTVSLLAVNAIAKDIIVAPGDSLAKTRDEAKPGDRILLKGGTYRLNENMAKAEVIARSIRPGDPVSVVLLGSEHRVLARNMMFDPAAFSELLSDQVATAESLDLDSVPRFLGNLATELSVPQREIYLISDMGEQAWQARSGFLKTSLRDLAADASVMMVPIDGGAENLGVTSL